MPRRVDWSMEHRSEKVCRFYCIEGVVREQKMLLANPKLDINAMKLRIGQPWNIIRNACE